tara:strand:- start:520 stop:1257 length:738 start_codon:yes stop_codon:yes gene_type:complete
MNFITNLFNNNPSSKQSDLDKSLINALILDKKDKAIEALEKGANPNSFSDQYLPAIYIAANRDQYELVKLLIDKGANINTKGSSKKMNIKDGFALLTSSVRGNLDITKLLVENKAKIDQTESSGLTPLMSASFKGKDIIVKYLIGNGALIDQKDNFGYTALMFAANAGKVKCVEILMKNGAKVEAKDNNDSTPIMFAAQHGFNDVVTLLLKNGADKYKKGNHGLNAIDFAKQNNLETTIKILEQK